jgi:hypothetical protein
LRLRTRYHAAQRCALIFLRQLRRVPLEERPTILRHFRALTWAQKLAYIA